MEGLFEHAPNIIEAAAKSPPGILALMIIALSLLAFFLFRDVTPRIRAIIFIMLFLGCATFAWATYRVGTDQPIQQPPSGTVINLQHVPAIPNDATTANIEKWFPVWLLNFFQKARIIIDSGSLQGTKSGDHFVVVEQKEIKNSEGKLLGVTQQPGSRVRVVEALPKFSICQLHAVAGSSFAAIDARLAEIKNDGDLQNQPELFAPVTTGQKVIQIPSEEIAWWEDLDKAIQKTLEKGNSDAEMKARYKAVADEADTFLQEHPTAYFAPDALFQKGWAQYQLQKYDELILTFERFVKQYPFHNSTEGAENWIEKAKSALNETKDTNP